MARPISFHAPLRCKPVLASNQILGGEPQAALPSNITIAMSFPEDLRWNHFPGISSLGSL